MVLLLGELFAFVAELFFLGAATREDPQQTRRAQAVRSALEQAARLLNGSVHKPWFGRRRIQGSHRGRDVEVIWRGSGKVEVRCRAPLGVELHGHVPLLSRLFGARQPRVSGDASHLAAGAMDLFRRYGLDSLRIQDGALVARARPALEAEHLAGLATALADLAWSEEAEARAASAPPIRVAARAPAAPAASSPQQGVRCPFCHDGLELDKPIVHCDACDAPHHPSCFEEGEGCSIQGCKHRKARGLRS